MIRDVRPPPGSVLLMGNAIYNFPPDVDGAATRSRRTRRVRSRISSRSGRQTDVLPVAHAIVTASCSSTWRSGTPTMSNSRTAEGVRARDGRNSISGTATTDLAVGRESNARVFRRCSTRTRLSCRGRVCKSGPGLRGARGGGGDCERLLGAAGFGQRRVVAAGVAVRRF